ncbi:uncharacterized protein LOC62_01G000053 [Vanrija pseudolonga]|uniref:Uncharacterized protein n=1 Tax=Vanrija pseudolonga TaxID=143232 RepID=A0AAF0XZ42_9TREE|nr:hypothetical protein LOC62_01G000053 [Vanrija pseudolonga]
MRQLRLTSPYLGDTAITVSTGSERGRRRRRRSNSLEVTESEPRPSQRRRSSPSYDPDDIYAPPPQPLRDRLAIANREFMHHWQRLANSYDAGRHGPAELALGRKLEIEVILARTPNPLLLFATPEEAAQVRIWRLYGPLLERQERVFDQMMGTPPRPAFPFRRFLDKVQIRVIDENTPDHLWQAWFDPPDSDSEATANDHRSDSEDDTLFDEEEPECPHTHDALLHLLGRPCEGYCSMRWYFTHHYQPGST